MRVASGRRGLALLATIVALAAVPAIAQENPGSAEVPLLVLLSDTGEERDGLPVLAVASGAEETYARLNRGLPGELFRVYRWIQIYRQSLEDGLEVEPAYVLLSERQGGYAREGFVLGEIEKPTAGYVDVHKDWPVAGKFGALDQIVPHELAHVIRRQLVGPLADGSANQVHALGLRTDPVTAFNEGFAEHLQPMAIDHPDADPATRSLAADGEAYERVSARLEAYRREVAARLAVAPRLRMGFLAWYSNDEDVLRYAAVKENAFARESDVPERLLGRSDLYDAYLLENILPGAPNGAAKTVPRLLSSEAVVATLFYRWANHEGIRTAYRSDDFYADFGARRDEVSPLANAYLKLFAVFHSAGPQGALDVVEAYKLRFPEEAALVDALVSEVFLGQKVEPTPELWLANKALQTGTTLFDQYRGLPRTHTFDLNGASLVDLMSVPGLDLTRARAIQAAVPFRGVEELASVPGVDETVLVRFRAMEEAMETLRAEAEEESVEDVISIQTIILPYAWRATAVLVGATVLGALIFHRMRSRDTTWRPGRLRPALAGLGAAIVSLGFGWALGGLASLAAVGALFALPAALWRLWRTRQRASAVNAFVAWIAAALPAVVLITPWF